MTTPAADDGRGRIVVIAAGFALWQNGRCIAAARWADIRRLRAYRAAATDPTVRLGVELADGTVLEFHERAPGFDLFLNRGAATLSGLLPVDQWHPAVALAAPGTEGMIIFDRSLLRR